MEEENERLKKSLRFIAEELEYTYDICEKYTDPWLTICTGGCYTAFNTDQPLRCQSCLKYYCESCWSGNACEKCELEYCGDCECNSCK